MHALLSLQSLPSTGVQALAVLPGSQTRQGSPSALLPAGWQLPSMMHTEVTGIAAHEPPTHLSSVHGSPSKMQAPSRGACTQLPVLSHKSDVQTLPSSHVFQTSGMHAPSLHVSVVEQGLPSVQLVSALARCTQPVWAVQLSVVQGLPSPQKTIVPVQFPAKSQVSSLVHALLSSHAPLVATLQLDVACSGKQRAQGWLALLSPLTRHAPSMKQCCGMTTPGLQTPLVQMPTVQGEFPSQPPTPSGLLVWVQPSGNAHSSLVHGSPSSQGLPLATQIPLAQLPSAGQMPAVVQVLASDNSTAMQLPPRQRTWVQGARIPKAPSHILSLVHEETSPAASAVSAVSAAPSSRSPSAAISDFPPSPLATSATSTLSAFASVGITHKPPRHFPLSHSES